MSDPDYKRVGSVEIRLIEEMSELTKEICKAKRFGYYDFHPDDPTEKPNGDRILLEIKDVREVLDEYERSLQ